MRSLLTLGSRAHVYAVALCLAAGVASLAAPSLAAAEECPNVAFRTGPSSRLPDCRAYEMVSPPFKDGGRLSRFDSSPDGSSALTGAFSAFAGLESFPGFPAAFYSTRRTTSGWVTVADQLPGSEYLPYLLDGFLDFTGASLGGQATVFMDRGVWQAGNRVDFFMRRPDHSIVDVGPGLPPTAPAGSPSEVAEPVNLSAVGVSADASRLFFEVDGRFWPFDGTEEGLRLHSLYEYLGVGNTTPMLVGVDDSGGLISKCGVVLGAGNPDGGAANGLVDSTHNAVSNDGNTVFFTAYPDNYKKDGCKGSAPPVAELFARIDNGLADARTVAISEPSGEDCSGCDTEAGVLADAHFEGASADGSRVFFTTTQPLLGNDTSSNVYEYDFTAPVGSRIARVSVGDATVSAPTAGVLPTTFSGGRESGGSPATLQVSEDGSHVYFLANGLLTRTPNGQGEAAEVGAANLYVFERDARYPAGRIAFVARLSAEDVGLWAPSLSASGVDVTPDGRFLVFTSNRDLTPDDTSTEQQVFEYDAQTGALVRVSVGQDGFNHNGNVPARADALGLVLDNATIVSQGYPSYESPYDPSTYWSHLSVSADGSYVFFQSPVGLTPQAIDQKVIGYKENDQGRPMYANNVYEYHAGRVSLISDGQDITNTTGNTGGESNVQLVGTNASGSDVFFSTADPLVAQDTDDNQDIYDARIGGGFPPPAPAASCSGDACQGQLSAGPTLLSPGSEFQAGGNPPLAVTPAVKPKAKSLTRAQQLAKALQTCRHKPKSKRAACETQARRRYGAKSKAKKSAKGRK